MNHDIIHCDGIECPLKERCVRYKVHLDLKENEYNGLYDYYIINPYGMVKRECPSLIGVGVCKNDETKHLLGTSDDCPDKYKTW